MLGLQIEFNICRLDHSASEPFNWEEVRKQRLSTVILCGLL